MEIIEQSESYCTLKDISHSSLNEFDAIARRTFYLIDDYISDLLSSIKQYDEDKFKTSNLSMIT